MRKALGLLLLMTPWLLAEDVIICGSGGTPEYEARFIDWSVRLRQTLVDQCHRPAEKVHLFAAEKLASEHDGKKLTLKDLQQFFSDLKASHSKEEPLFVYLIGHGSHLRNTAKFQLPGPDLTALDFAGMLGDIAASALVVINGSSASAGFINVLTGPERVVVAATKSSREINATEYIGYFVQALEEGLADRDGDRRVSVYEASWRAASLTQNHYTAQGLIATEHAILDDDGDGLGTRIFTESILEIVNQPSPDGLLARRIFIKDFKYPDVVPKSLVASYEAQLQKVEALKIKKDQMKSNTYRRRLENLLIQAARLNQRIHKLLPVETSK